MVMVRIVHVITKGDVGGAQTHVVELTSAQIRAGHEAIVVAGTEGPAMDRCRDHGVCVVVVPSLGAARTTLWQRPALADLRRTLAELRPDVVHAHSSNGGFLARIACRREGLVCVYTAHGWPFQRGAAFRQRVLSFVGEFVAGRLGDGVICLTDAEADRARRAHVVRRGRLWVVPNGLSDVPPHLRRHHTEGSPAFVMVARFAPPKLQRELLDVMADVRDLDWTLTFVGDGPELDACREHAERSIPDRVRFVGHRDDVPSLLAEHDVAVLWSAYEGMPISLLEGMRAGLCCLASDLPGVRALFGVPLAGVVAGSKAELATAIEDLVRNDRRRTELGDQARMRFVEAFSAEAMERAVARVYEHVITRRSVAGRA
jgi:glycosyltransferase involved in cell wall biosynthesis